MANKANEFSELLKQSDAAWIAYQSAQSMHYCYLKLVREYLKEGPVPEATLELVDAESEKTEQAYKAWCAISDQMSVVASSWNDEPAAQTAVAA